MGRRARVLTGGVLLLAHISTACTSWQVPAVSPQELIAREHPRVIQVREQGGAVYVLTAPRLAGDSLTGYVRGEWREQPVERRIPLITVDRVAVRRFNVIKTLGLIVVPPVVALAVLVGLVCSSGNCNGHD